MRKNLLLLTMIFTSFFGFTQQTLDPEIEIIIKYPNVKKWDTLTCENSFANRIEFDMKTEILFRSKSSTNGIHIDSIQFYEQNSGNLIINTNDLKYYGCFPNEEFQINLENLRKFEYLNINILKRSTIYNTHIYCRFKGITYLFIFRYNNLDIFKNFEVKHYPVKKAEVIENVVEAMVDSTGTSKDSITKKIIKKKVINKIHKSNNEFETKALHHKDIIRVTPKYKNKLTLTLKIINQFDNTKFIELKLGDHNDFFDFSIHELINTLNLLNRNDIEHGNIIHLNIKSEYEEGNLYFEYKRHVSPQIAKIYSPVLMKLDGGLSDFGFSDIAPSIGFGLCNFNFNVSGFRYMGLNTIVSVFQFEEENEEGEASTRYSLSTGIYADINGYFSVGYMHDFKEESSFWIIGFRLEELRKVLFKDE